MFFAFRNEWEKAYHHWASEDEFFAFRNGWEKAYHHWMFFAFRDGWEKAYHHWAAEDEFFAFRDGWEKAYHHWPSASRRRCSKKHKTLKYIFYCSLMTFKYVCDFK